ncbi:bromodomain-containing protein [Theileria equi strain WA]|uniref:Bromodomain-containing protein n=1 Tax=Theileria equi strain WA TaxID=1537102 RepID=L0AZT8_THEEQ|nr:bromodomain-containing protein [Theileria equi strain WA]AFZ81085.1 bromodomain-containing protein [Theileria equi strain WA]|eukprot:XP_004830751.1 bromodomain-containing protein [Theileria equi strain WA]
MKDFKKVKSRVGKSQFRKYGSKDEKLLANVGQLKKTVKLSQQSIAADKGCLNVTSRRLTLAELIGKSRHNSENVRNHALMGIVEFVRRYVDEGRLNLCLIIQVTASNLIHESTSVRTRAKNLLMSIISTYLSDESIYDNKCIEYLYLYLIKGLLSTNGPVREDTLMIISLVVDKTPWILSNYCDKLLDKIISNAPKSPSFKHINCVTLLFKTLEDADLDLQNRIVEYVINSLLSLLSRDDPISFKSATKSEKNGIRDKKNAPGTPNEVECLSMTSMVVKLLKLLLNSIKLVRPNDRRVVDILLGIDIYEYENLTPKGKETFETLYYEFTFIKSEIAIKLLKTYTGHGVALLAPFFLLESMKNKFSDKHHDRVAQVLMIAVSVDSQKLSEIQDAEMKVEWITHILTILSNSNLEVTTIKNWLKSSVVYSRIKNNQFDALGSISVRSQTKESPTNPEIVDLPKVYKSIIESLLAVISKSPSIWPLLGLVKGLSPLVFSEVFPKNHGSGHWEYLNNLSMDISVATDWNVDFDSIICEFIEATNGELLTVFLKLILYISRRTGTCKNFLDKLHDKVQVFSDDQHRIFSRIAMNIESSEHNITVLVEILGKLVHNENISHEYVSVILFHIFNTKLPSKIDKDGRIKANSELDVTMQHVDYTLKIYDDMLKNCRCTRVFLELMVKMLIDRYLLAVCRLQNSCTHTLVEALDMIMNGSFLQLCNNLTETHKSTTLDVLNAVIPEYLGKDSIPQWITTNGDSI